MIKKVLIFTILLCSITSWSFAQGEKGVYVDNKGNIRWENDKEKAYFFGVNYVAPFAFGYRQIRAKGMSVKAAIRQDVYHFARMGINAFRIHVFDTEISDSLGNLKENRHLELLDYLIAELEKRDIKIIITPIAFWGNGYPEKDIQTGAFSYKYGKKGALINKTAWKAQENYLTQFFSRKNVYTGKTYQEDNNIVATEVNNEPWHSGNKELVTQYINKMVQSIRNTGWTKPIFYNISESPEFADAVVKSKAQGYTFQWYPTGLVAGRTQYGNFLPHVSHYRIPFDTIPDFNKGAKMIYEFAAADISGSYIYPEMAKSFRQAGFQWATMFAYDPMAIADVNTDYQTHYLNLAYTPSKAISFMIANEVFRKGVDFMRSYEKNRSQLLTDTLFYYSNSSDIRPNHLTRLKHIAGVGNSSVVTYEGSGAYFLDKLQKGIWRLEVMPDVIPLSDPFATPSPKKKVRGIEWNKNEMVLSLPDLGEDFMVQGINSGNNFQTKAKNDQFYISPGTYILYRGNKKSFEVNPNRKIGEILMSEFVAPKPDTSIGVVVNHEPPRTLSVNSDFKIKASIFGINRKDSVTVLLMPLSGHWETIPMHRRGEEYIAEVPKNDLHAGLLKYVIIVHSEKGDHTFPGKYERNPKDWDFYSKEAYQVFVNRGKANLLLFNAERDRQKINFYIPDWKRCGYSFVATSESNQLGLKLDIKKGASIQFIGWQVYVGDLVQHREQDLEKFNTVVIKGSGSQDSLRVKVSLITKSGNSYAAYFRLDDSLSEVSIPLIAFKQEGLLLLPRAYPGFQSLYYHSGIKKSLRIDNVEKISLTFPYNKDLESKDYKSISETVLQIAFE